MSRPSRIVQLYRRSDDVAPCDQYYPRGTTAEIGEKMPERARAVGARKAALHDLDPDTLEIGAVALLTWLETAT